MQPVLFPLATPFCGTNSAVPSIPPPYSFSAPTLQSIAGTARDASGIALPGCTVTLFRVDTDVNGVKTYVQVNQTTSDASGNYSFAGGSAENYQITFSLPGSPVRAGITLDTLIAT